MKIHAILLHGLTPYLKEKPCSTQGLEAKAIKESKLKSDQTIHQAIHQTNIRPFPRHSYPTLENISHGDPST